MKILYFYQYFSTPKGAWGTRVYEFAKEWVKKGHEVTVVTAVYVKSDLQPKKFIDIQYFDGIKVIIINIKIDNKQIFIKRILTFFLYMIISCWYAIVYKTDVVIASSGPLTVGIPGLLSRLARKKKLIFEVRDLLPQVLIELGIIKSTFIKWLVFKFEYLCYKKADLIITLSPGMQQNIFERFGYTHIITIPNASDIELFGKTTFNHLPDILSNSQYAIYAGNIGHVNNSFLLFRAAIELIQLNRKDIIIVLVGSGQQKEELINKARDEKVKNFLVLDLMPKIELVNLLQNSIASIIPLINNPIFNTSSPNKLFESLACGIPVIQTTQGWIKDLLEQAECGYTISPNSAKELAYKLIQLADNKELRKLLGNNGKKLAVQNFDKHKLAIKMLTHIRKL